MLTGVKANLQTLSWDEVLEYADLVDNEQWDIRNSHDQGEIYWENRAIVYYRSLQHLNYTLCSKTKQSKPDHAKWPKNKL